MVQSIAGKYGRATVFKETEKTCTTSENPDQLVHSHSLISLC